MPTQQGGNNESNGAGKEGGQADENNSVAEDWGEDDIILEADTMTDLLPMQQPQNGEGYGVLEGGRWNGDSFAGLGPSTLFNEDPRNGPPNNNLAAANLNPPHVPLNNWHRSPDVPITDLLHLLGLREERHQARRRASAARKNHKHKPKQRK